MAYTNVILRFRIAEVRGNFHAESLQKDSEAGRLWVTAQGFGIASDFYNDLCHMR